MATLYYTTTSCGLASFTIANARGLFASGAVKAAHQVRN